MEVHHHTHAGPDVHREHRKKWTHYFWEFLMLFLAVFCGFLAENKREHIIEHRREKQYMAAMVTDLKIDTTNINAVLRASKLRIENYDSLRNLLKSPGLEQKMNQVYYYFLPTTSYNLFNPTRRAIDQLINSGGLRLVRNQDVSDSITDYYNKVKAVEGQGNTWLRYFDQYHEVAFRIFDYSQIDTFFYDRKQVLGSSTTYALLTNDFKDLKTLYNKLFALQFILRSYMNYLESLREKAVSTLQFIIDEYNIH